jgi:hypothetical protein
MQTAYDSPIAFGLESIGLVAGGAPERALIGHRIYTANPRPLVKAKIATRDEVSAARAQWHVERAVDPVYPGPDVIVRNVPTLLEGGEEGR